MSSVKQLKAQKRAIVERYTRPDDRKGLTQILTTLVPLAALWYAVPLSAQWSYLATAGITFLMSLFLLRVFVLMHECGHGSLFRRQPLNKAFGFVLGVISGMPQYVWSQHHDYHHKTNGNWAKYRGPLAILSVEEYERLSEAQRRQYRRARSIWMAPLGGFLYLILNPRLTWLKGSIALLAHITRRKIAEPRVTIRAHAAAFQTNYWASSSQYWHMFWNNVALVAAAAALAAAIGPALFFPVYLISLSLAGGAGIVLFTVQHNFEDAYATADEGWDYDSAAVHGTSFLVLPRWLNWFTANIGYHHVHHLSARIPNYCLAACHEEHQHLFQDVRRLSLADIARQLQFILWDARERRIVSIAE